MAAEGSRRDGAPRSEAASNGASENERIALALEEVAELLAAQEANPFRVRAWRNGAEAVRRLPRPARELLAERGVEGLIEVPAIGRALARAIESLVHTGRLALLERLRGEVEGVELFATVPGLGPELGRRIHDHLGIETLQELEVAAWDGRLRTVPGMGSRRVRAVRESLAGRYRRPSARGAPRLPKEEPPVEEILDVDAEYRAKAEHGELARIAPRRFNPEGEAWLPVLHARRGERHYTALFSNTARAHELGTTRDWVVIYRDDGGGDGQWTVVTARLGPLRGRRIVRGREAECEALEGRRPSG